MRLLGPIIGLLRAVWEERPKLLLALVVILIFGAWSLVLLGYLISSFPP